jgi:hypothetical protein
LRLAVNEEGRVYQRGKSKLLIYTRINRLCGSSIDAIGSVNLSQVGRETNTSHKFVHKVRDEMLDHDGNILHPDLINQKRKLGPGANTFDEMDMFVLLHLYLEEPSALVNVCTNALCN